MARILIDLSPLRASADFRRLWVGTTVSTVGGQFTFFAVMLQVWEMTHDALWTGAVGVAHAVPAVVMALVGGTLADSVDRRRLVVASAVAQLVIAALLAAQAIADVDSPLLVLLLAAALASFASLGAPARRTFIPHLLPPDLLAAGLALSQTSFQLAMLVGPALAGVAAAAWGVEACYAVDAASFAVAAYAASRLPAIRTERAPDAASGPRLSPWRRTWQGVGYAARRPVLRGAFLTDVAATCLAMPVALFPLVNEDRFGGSPTTLGLLLTSVAAGGLAASLSSSLFTRVARLGRLMLACAATWGLALAAFGVVSSLAATLLALAVAGAADTISVVARGAIIQSATPDDFRGRVAALESIVGMSGPDVGNFRAGVVGSATSHETALVTGGLMCVGAVSLIAWRNRALREFTVLRTASSSAAG